MKQLFLLFLLPVFGSIAVAQNNETRKSYYPNGKVQFEYTYVNDIPEGPYKAYKQNGEIWSIGNYTKGQLSGDFTVYAKSNVIARKDTYRNGQLWEQTVFYQEYPDYTYKRISKTGYVSVRNGESVTPDKTTPNGFIITEYDPVTFAEQHYVWTNGKKASLALPKPDGTRETIHTGSDPGVYEWKKKKRVFIRPLNESDKIQPDIESQIQQKLNEMMAMEAIELIPDFEPLELAKKIFGKDSLQNLEHYITGEYKGRPNGQDLLKVAETRFALLGQTENKAVVAMTLLDSAGIGLDTYLHFVKDTIWKMTAFRSLAMTGIIDQVKTELEKLSPLQVDSILKKAKQPAKKGKTPMFASRAEYDFELGNARLILELDDNIAKHFTTNRVEFERLKNLAVAQLEKEKPDTERNTKLINQLKADYQKVFISAVSTGGYELGNCIVFLIGGMIDNTVGYIYVKDKKDLPSMTPNRIIMIKEIGNGWYIYKTT